MAKNDFKAFATDRNANVISQEEWEALPALLSGFTAGKASSAQVNKVIRQASFIAAALAQFVSDKTQRDVLDNGDLPGFVELLGSGFAVEYLSRKNPFGDIKSDGTVKTALENLGLGEGAPAIGVPFFWPSAAMPNTVIDSWSSMVFLKFNGAKFSATDYPVLAKAFPALALPDARGDFIRIWDDGRGIDVGRTLLSGQSHTIMDHAHNMELWTGDGLAAGSAREGVNPGILATYGDGGIVKTDEPGLKVPSSLRALSSRSVKRYGEISGNVDTETRPRNIAFNFLVRAK
ncbi:phage tail protein [Escherichia coli]|uniref:phage tail protein n=8 Tax=Escherichia coli TaxID=562 RepID=UPI000BE5700E|nr:phage tail protein [Escherichia coli]EES1005297.1 phage tail protein [Escherichia coli]EET0743411.1 phage tail protein [Escherichia coli]EFG2073555.1 phage tail protein [Escherichia coli]EFG4512945.1 phage tail protein [Escherichia coli]EFL6127532.1 phage tail protein [Escherichia coli]